jgi:hypothetical protein
MYSILDTETTEAITIMIYFHTKDHISVNLHIEETKRLPHYLTVVSVQADGDELSKCNLILGRSNNYSERVHTFIGDAAKEIAANWR